MQTLVKSGLWEIKKVRRSLSVFLILFLFLYSSLALSFSIPPELLDLKNRGEFLSHDDWLGVSFPVKEIIKLKKQIEEKKQVRLFTLSDSYLMIITTQEWAILKAALKMSDLEKIFKDKKLNQIKLEPKCIARLEGQVGEHTYSQWALIFKENKKIKDYRHDIRRLFRARGGQGDDFQVSRWQPLLVLGFSSREYFDQDGLIKTNQAQCVFNFE